MSEQTEGGWSNRKKTFTVGGALGAIASLVTIVSFLTGQPGSAPSPIQTPVSPAPAVTGFDSTALPSSAGSGYPVSVQNAILSYCEQTFGEPLSYCRCDLSWLDANIPYSLFVGNPQEFVQEADGYASC